MPKQWCGALVCVRLGRSTKCNQPDPLSLFDGSWHQANGMLQSPTNRSCMSGVIGLWPNTAIVVVPGLNKAGPRETLSLSDATHICCGWVVDCSLVLGSWLVPKMI